RLRGSPPSGDPGNDTRAARRGSVRGCVPRGAGHVAGRCRRPPAGDVTPATALSLDSPRMASPAKDLREWIALLERENELVRVTAEVDPELEITEITDRIVKAGGPALPFEKVKGSRLPLLINQFGTERRMCLAFGVERLDDVAAKLEEVLELTPPQGLVEKVRKLGTLKSIADSAPKSVSKGPCQEVV